MAFTLELDYKERNDNKVLTFYDISKYGEELVMYTQGGILEPNTMYQIITDGGNGTFTGIGAGSTDPGTRFVSTSAVTLAAGDACMEVTPLPSEIVSAELKIKYTTSNGTESSEYTIDLFGDFGPFVSQDQLVFNIDKSYLSGTNEDILPDGIYDIKYSVSYRGLNNDPTNTTEFTPEMLETFILVYGVIKVKVYDKLRKVPIAYMCDNNQTVPEIEEAELAYTYLKSIEASAYVSKRDELLRMLATLERMIVIGTNIY
jgi:hypothetical protein